MCRAHTATVQGWCSGRCWHFSNLLWRVRATPWHCSGWYHSCRFTCLIVHVWEEESSYLTQERYSETLKPGLWVRLMTAKSSGRRSPTSKRNFALRRPGWKSVTFTFSLNLFLNRMWIKVNAWNNFIGGGATIYLISAPKISMYLFVKTRKRFEKYQAVYSFCHIISS